MGDNRETLRSSGEKSTTDKLQELKKFIDKNEKFVPDVVEEKLKNSIETTRQILKIKEFVDKALDYVDSDIDVMDYLDEIKSGLIKIKKIAEWLRDSESGDFILGKLAEIIVLIDEFIELSEQLKKIGLEGNEKEKVVESMKVILGKVSVLIEEAIKAIDFVDKLRKVDFENFGVDELGKLKDLIQ